MRKTKLLIVVVSILALLTAFACSNDGESDNNGGGDGSYDLTVAISGDGSTSPSEGSHTYNKGTEVSISATPDEGWEFDGWSGDVDNADSASTTVTMDGDKTVTANFSEIATAAEQWAAYTFDEMVYPASGDSGTVKSFTIVETYIEEGVTRQFQIDSEFQGIDTGAAIKTDKLNMSTFETTTITNSVDCYKIKHHITVLQAAEEDDNPAWADVTIWIPTTGFETTSMYFWIYPKATYVDSNGNTGEWDYYLTQAMQDEMDGGTATYLPYTEGDFYGFDQWTLMGLYGWAWTWFSAYATGGDEYLQEGSWDYSYGGVGYTYSCSSETENIGSYAFNAWNLKITWNYGGESAEYSGIFSPDLPVPIFLRVGGSGGGSDNYFQYELTDLVLE